MATDQPRPVPEVPGGKALSEQPGPGRTGTKKADLMVAVIMHIGRSHYAFDKA